MTPNPKPTKKAKKGARTAPGRRYNTPKSSQKHVRKLNVIRPVCSIVQKNLSHLTGKMKIRGDVKKYSSISRILSRIANLSNGKIWSWRYIASVHHGTMEPSKKFISALNAYMKNQDIKKMRRCYFAGRHGVLVAFDSSVIIDIISGCIKDLGYKPVSYSRYMEVKRKAVKK